MSLEHELGLRRPIVLLSHEALLNIYHTASCLKKRVGEFLHPFGLTDAQFNLMMLLQHQSGPEGGLSQTELSDMMLVNRANITSLIDRMEKSGLVARTALPSDRRYNIIRLAVRGNKLLAQVEQLYAEEVKKIMVILEGTEQQGLIKALEKIREELAV